MKKLMKAKDVVLYIVNILSIIFIAMTPSTFSNESDAAFSSRCARECTGNWQGDLNKDTCDFKAEGVRIFLFVLYVMAIVDTIYVLFYYAVRYQVNPFAILFYETHEKIYQKWSSTTSITLGVIAGLFNMFFYISTNDDFITEKCESKCANGTFQCTGTSVLSVLRIIMAIVSISIGAISALFNFFSRHISHSLMLWSIIRWSVQPFPFIFRIFRPVVHKSQVLRQPTSQVHEIYLSSTESVSKDEENKSNKK